KNDSRRALCAHPRERLACISGQAHERQRQRQRGERAMRATQSGVILEALRQAGGNWVSVWELFELSKSLCVHSRIADLRKLGHQIENRTRHENGRCLSDYRYIGTDPPPR